MHHFYTAGDSIRGALEPFDNNSIDRNDMHHNDEVHDYICDDSGDAIIIKRKDEHGYNTATSNDLSVQNEENIAYEFFTLYSATRKESILSNATLEGALNVFDLPNLLKELDHDLELVQKQSKSKEDHVSYFNQNVNDKFRRLSYKYHPDRISNKGGTTEEIKKATELQTAVNTVWNVLKTLHGNFIDNNYLSDQNFKYSTCSTVEIAILNNEERLKNLNNKILIELCWLSRIKQEKMIPNLNKFLKCCESCVESFFENERDFEKVRMQALSCFNVYSSEYNKLLSAAETLCEECERDSDLAYIKPMAEKMAKESLNHINILKRVKKLYFQQFVNIKCFESDVSNAEIDFISPFLEYSALLYTCKEITKKRNEGNERWTKAWLGNIVTSVSACMPVILTDGQYSFAQQTLETPNAFDDHHDFHRVSSLSENIVEKKRKMSNDELEMLGKVLKDRAGDDIHYHLLNFLTSYYCQRGKNEKFTINKILQQELKLAERIHWETCVEPLSVVVSTYAEYLKERFRPIKVYSECDIKDFKKDIEKILEEFTASMREEAKKGQQEVRDGQIRMSNELNEMNKEFSAAIEEAKDKSAQSFKKIEDKLREDENNRKRLEECLENEKLERAKRERELKSELEEKAKVEETKLREKSEKAFKEEEERLSKQLQDFAKTMKVFESIFGEGKS